MWNFVIRRALARGRLQSNRKSRFHPACFARVKPVATIFGIAKNPEGCVESN